jgi:hypothetical protein
MTRAVDAEAPLPCGRTVAELSDVAADPADAPAELVRHADTCPYCGPELAELRRRWALVRRAAGTPVPTPPGLVPRVLASVRELRAVRHLSGVELAQPGGRLRVAGTAVLLLARGLVREFANDRPGVALRGLTVDEDGLRVQLALPYDGASIAGTAAELRAWLRRGLAEHLGEAVPVIDVHVVDVLPN